MKENNNLNRKMLNVYGQFKVTHESLLGLSAQDKTTLERVAQRNNWTQDSNGHLLSELITLRILREGGTPFEQNLELPWDDDDSLPQLLQVVKPQLLVMDCMAKKQQLAGRVLRISMHTSEIDGNSFFLNRTSPRALHDRLRREVRSEMLTTPETPVLLGARPIHLDNLFQTVEVAMRETAQGEIEFVRWVEVLEHEFCMSNNQPQLRSRQLVYYNSDWPEETQVGLNWLDHQRVQTVLAHALSQYSNDFYGHDHNYLAPEPTEKGLALAQSLSPAERAKKALADKEREAERERERQERQERDTLRSELSSLLANLEEEVQKLPAAMAAIRNVRKDTLPEDLQIGELKSFTEAFLKALAVLRLGGTPSIHIEELADALGKSQEERQKLGVTEDFFKDILKKLAAAHKAAEAAPKREESKPTTEKEEIAPVVSAAHRLLLERADALLESSNKWENDFFTETNRSKAFTKEENLCKLELLQASSQVIEHSQSLRGGNATPHQVRNFEKKLARLEAAVEKTERLERKYRKNIEAEAAAEAAKKAREDADYAEFLAAIGETAPQVTKTGGVLQTEVIKPAPAPKPEPEIQEVATKEETPSEPVANPSEPLPEQEETVATIETPEPREEPEEEPVASPLANDDNETPTPIISPRKNRELVAAALDFARENMAVEENVLKRVSSALQRHRPLLLQGAPGTGKTMLATLLAESLCGKGNYTLVTADARWTGKDLIGGLQVKPGEGLQYSFQMGIVTLAAKRHMESMRLHGRPHALIIDEFNRASQDEALSRLLTALDHAYRDTMPLVGPEDHADETVYLPRDFVLMATMNDADVATLNHIGSALSRRFNSISVGLAKNEEEHLLRSFPGSQNEQNLNVLYRFIGRPNDLAITQGRLRHFVPVGAFFVREALDMMNTGLNADEALLGICEPLLEALDAEALKSLAATARSNGFGELHDRLREREQGLLF